MFWRVNAAAERGSHVCSSALHKLYNFANLESTATVGERGGASRTFTSLDDSNYFYIIFSFHLFCCQKKYCVGEKGTCGVSCPTLTASQTRSSSGGGGLRRRILGCAWGT
jgi:hypothetical protein